MRRYINRSDAGRELVPMLQAFANHSNVIVLGLPRGGIPVAAAVAEALDVPLDVLTVQKLVLPGTDAWAVGAITPGGMTTVDWRVADALRVSDAALDAMIAREHVELERRELKYRGDAPVEPVTGKTVIIIDDGVATGATMMAAVAAVRRLEPSRIVVAAPIASREAAAALASVADVCVWGYVPLRLYCVSLWYEDFTPLSDAQVLASLRRVHAPRGRSGLPEMVGQTDAEPEVVAGVLPPGQRRLVAREIVAHFGA